MAGVYRIRGKVRHYDWGGERFLSTLLGRQSDGRPWAEYWLGAHPGDPAEVLLDGGWHALDALIDADPRRWLGQEVADRFGQLPYLMKVLDVGRPLSIQVHPNKIQAQKGFAREQAQGIAPDAAERNFKDRNHKPELALALSEFWLLYGFRPAREIAATLERYPSLNNLRPLLDRGIDALFGTVMRADRTQLARWLEPILESSGSERADDPDYWIGRWRAVHATAAQAVDPGAFGFFLMNLVRLAPGDTIFQGANIPHAYLSGQCVEIMANSDNVLRGGLTSKHVDPDGLQRHISFQESTVVRNSAPDCDEFRLQHLAGESGQAMCVDAPGAGIFLLLRGRVEGQEQQLSAGQALFMTPGSNLELRCLEKSRAVLALPGPRGTP